MQDDSASAYVRVLFHQNRSGTQAKEFGWNRPVHQMLTRSIMLSVAPVAVLVAGAAGTGPPLPQVVGSFDLREAGGAADGRLNTSPKQHSPGCESSGPFALRPWPVRHSRRRVSR